MHGRLKVKEKAEIELEKRRKYQEKATRFKHGLDLCLKAKSNNDYNDEVMRISWDLVVTNPDVYSVWNLRKEYIMIKKQEYERELQELRACVLQATDGEEKNDTKTEQELTEQFQKLCNQELELTEYALLKNSKSYSAWQHRLWILGLIPRPNFKREFQLNEAYLQKDGRNLHCWHYRTNLCNISGRNIEEEIKFSLDRIKDNLSAFSYSTLYYRSLTLTKASNAGLIDFSKCWSDEYAMVENALFTEPNDQALWFYLRWLLLTNFGQCLSLNEQQQSDVGRLVKVIFVNENRMLIFYFNKVLKVFPFNDELTLSAKDGSRLTITRDQLNCVLHRQSKFWFVQLNDEVQGLTEINLGEKHLMLGDNDLQGYQVWTSDDELEQSSNLQMRIHDEQLKSLLTLKELEPDNKWLNLILSYFENTDQLQILDDLIKLDPLRTNYYEDQKSKIKFEKLISNSNLNLTGHQLTVLYTPEPLAHLTTLDLTGNRISCLSTNFNCLVSLKNLNLDHNLVDKIQKNFTLPNLENLSLQFNKLTKHSGLEHLTNCPKLKIIFLFGNDLSEVEPYRTILLNAVEGTPFNLT